jgi:acetyl esterase/lipase
MRTVAIVFCLTLVLLPDAARAQVKIVKDVDYIPGTDYADGKDRLDIYAPDGAKNTPVIIALHGGGLTQGDRSQQAFVGQRFASAGYVTVIPSYRLSPAVSHPAHVQDVAAAFAWVKQHINRHGGDPGRILVIGHSAGAYLAALVATDPRYLAAHKLSTKDIAGAVPVAGFFWVEKTGVAPDRPKTVWGTEEAAWKAASPARYLRRDLPPILLIYADGDDEWRRKQNDEMGAALRAAGHSDVAVREVKNRTHNTVWSKMNDGQDEETSTLILAFAKRVLSPRTSH